MRTIDQKYWRLIYLVVYISTLSFIFGGTLAQHFSRGMQLEYYNDDVRQQIWPFFKFSEEGLFEEDYIAEYYISGLPSGYKALYFLAAKSGIVYTVSNLLPYILLLITFIGIGVSTCKLSGWIVSWMSVAFMLSSSLYLEQMMGGIPRTFAFPLIAWLCVALVYGNPIILLIIAVLGAGFYPVVASISGLTLFAWLFLLPKRGRGQAGDWSFRSRAAFLTLAGFLVLCLVIPQMLLVKPFGPLLRSKEVEEFPELLPDGRYEGGYERLPFEPYITELRKYAKQALPTNIKDSAFAQYVWFGALLIATIGTGILLWKSVPSRRLALLFLVSSVLYFASQPISPMLFFPQRYLVYTIPVLATIFFSGRNIFLFIMALSFREVSVEQIAFCAAYQWFSPGYRGEYRFY